MKSFPQCKTVGWIVSFKIKAVYLSEEVLVTDGNLKKQGEVESVPQATLPQTAIDSFREQLSQEFLARTKLVDDWGGAKSAPSATLSFR